MSTAHMPSCFADSNIRATSKLVGEERAPCTQRKREASTLLIGGEVGSVVVDGGSVVVDGGSVVVDGGSVVVPGARQPDGIQLPTTTTKSQHSARRYNTGSGGCL